MTPEQAALARWAVPTRLSIVPAAGAVLGNGRVLFWSAESRNSFASGSQTYTTLFDPATNSATEALVSNTGHDMFCPGTAALPDGRLLVNGGLSAGSTSIYDPATNRWSSATGMNVPRAYNSSVVQSDGSVLTMGGSWNGPNAGVRPAEVWTAAGGWRALSGLPESPFRMNGPFSAFRSWPDDSHFALLPTGNGRVLFAGPAVDMAWLDTRGSGQWSPAGRRGDDRVSFSGNFLMYEAGRIFKTGGSTVDDPRALADSFVIDTTSGTAQTRRVASMAYPRIYANSVVLPNGQIIVVGGQTYRVEFSDDYAVLAPELWDPETERFTTLPPMSVPRNYHSLAMLLPDGRVVSAGGGLCNCAADHPDLQILSPPYLFNADGSMATRPAITAAPTTAGYGSKIAVTTDSPVVAFSLVRLGAATHTVNNDQRRVSVSFTARSTTAYDVDIPSNAGILLPGQWMLFAMNATGTPSVARIITVDGVGAPVVENPGNTAATVGRPLSIPITARTNSGTLRYSALNLPAGLAIDPVSGIISGTPASAGSALVTVLASNGSQTVGTDLRIDTLTVGTGTGLLAEYYATTGMVGSPALQRIEAVDFGWGSGAPGIGVPADNFAVRWNGWIEPTATGSTALRTISDDGVRVWVDGRLVIDNWTGHSPTADTASIATVAGRRLPITIEYYEGGGDATLRLQWQPPGTTSFVTVPADRLYAGRATSTSNLALGRSATQSSTVAGGLASRATDGNRSGSYGDASVSHTDYERAPWWQVDLGRNSRVDLVQLWNRTDCCADRLRNATVYLSPTDMTGRSAEQLRADPAVTVREFGSSNVAPLIGVPFASQGRYVRVQLAATEYLSLAEVQVMGAPAVYGTPTIASVAAQETLLGAEVNLTLSASDPDGNPLQYRASGLPAGISLNTSTGVIGGRPTAAGSTTVDVTVSNDGGNSATTRFAWTVIGAIPEVTALPAPIVASGSTVRYAPTLSAGASAEYSWNFGDGSPDTPFRSSPAIDHPYAAAGIYTVTLTVRTLDGRSSSYRFVQAVTAGTAATGQPRSSNPIAFEPRTGANARLWNVNPDNDSVTVFDAANNSRIGEISVGGSPRSIARAADGRLWVANKRSGSISIINPTTLAVAQTVTLPAGSQPHALVVSPIDGSMFVTLEASGRLLKLNGSSGAVLAELNVGEHPRHLALSADGQRLLLSRFISRPLPGEGTAQVRTTDASGVALGAEVLTIDPATLGLQRTVVLAHSERSDTEAQGRGLPNYLGAAAISPDGASAWVPSKQDNILRGGLRNGRPLDFQNTVRAISSRIDLASGSEDHAARIDHDNASIASAALYHPSGAYVFVALETNRQVAVVDAAGRRELFRLEAGLAPQGLALSADGRRLYVHNFMGRSVSAIDLSALIDSGRIGGTTTATLPSVSAERLTANILRGKQLFYDARDPRLARDSYMSCASCHNDAGHDGRTWDLTHLGEGLRNTPALNGRAGLGQGFAHWSANFDEIQDFEGQIRSLAGGTGLMSDADFNAGSRAQALGDRKAGISADLDALAAYLGSLTATAPSPHRNADGTLSAEAQAGRSTFIQRNCASCHGGTGFTLSADGNALRNIGTLKASSGRRLNASLAGIDTPTLRDVWATAPYLHDGSAATLADALAAHNAASLGGTALGATEVANLSAYLRQIGSQETAAPAPTPPANLAQGKATVQSSTEFGGTAARAVDGNTSGSYGSNSITHTGWQAQPWWQVDLGRPAQIEQVLLFNRTDCCSDRLRNFHVFASATDMSGRTLAQLQSDAAVSKLQVAGLNGAPSIALPFAAQARFLRVQLADTNYLSLAEVQVLGSFLPGTVSSGTSPIFGSTAGTAFTDPVAANQVLTGVRVRSGWWIDSLQGLGTPADLPAHGGTGGGTYTVRWPAGEYLVRVYGRWGSGGPIGQISFVTNTGRTYGPYGTAQGVGRLTAFDYTVPEGTRVLGFTGRASGSLNAIGVIYGP